MKKPFIEIDAEHFTLSAFETKPIDGYKLPTNEETGEQFPNCCGFHKNVYEIAENWFKSFPNCCDQHREMTSKTWYNKANYNGIENKIVKQLSYTEHHITEQINIKDWYKDITDYIVYNVWSFGQPAIGLHIYLNNVLHYLENTKSEISKDKRKKLIEFIDTYFQPKEVETTNFNMLYSTYHKWYKIFPFELSMFSHLKEHFKGLLPIINGTPEVNKYLGTAKVKMHTKSSLIDTLLKLTNTLVTQINTSTLFEKGLLTEPNKIKLELILNARKLKIKQGYVNNSQNEETRYRKILKEWFKDEKKFITEVTPLIEKLPTQPIQTPFNFENNFDIVSTDKIYFHFNTGLVESKMLNKDELEKYLKAAFENTKPPKNQFNIKNAQSKDKVMKVFYQYYKNVAGKPHGKQKEYAGLLGKYFQGYKTSTVSSNFSKTIY